MGQVGSLLTFTSAEVYSGSFCRLGASDSMGRQGVSVSMCVGEAGFLDWQGWAVVAGRCWWEAIFL